MEDENEKLVQELEAARIAEETPAATTEDSSPVSTEKEPADPFMEEAMKNGYNPNYQGIDKKSPEQYVKDGSFFKKINQQKSEINELKTAFREISRQLKKSERVGYEKAQRELNEQKVAAIEVGDTQRVFAIDTELDVIKDELRKPDAPELQEPQKAPEVPKAAMDFKEKNASWFGKTVGVATTDEEKENQEMTETALVYDDYLGRMKAEGKLNATPEEALQMVQDRIKKYYPHRFENQKKAEPMAVGRPTIGNEVVVKAGSVGSLTDRQRQLYQTYISIDPNFGTIEDYAKHLEKIGELR